MLKRCIQFLFIFSFLIRCNSIEHKKIIEEKDGFHDIEFDQLKFNEQLVHLIAFQDLLDSNKIINSIYDSIQRYGDHFLAIVDKVESDKVSIDIDLVNFMYGDIPCIKSRNLRIFSLDDVDSVYLDNQLIELKNLSEDSLISFIGDYREGYEFPEYRKKNIPLLGDTLVSKHLFQIQTNLIDSIVGNRTNWKLVFSLVNQLLEAYQNIRERASLAIWNKEYTELDNKQQRAVIMLHPLRIHIYPNVDYLKPIPVPPPPPPQPADSLTIEMIVEDDPFDTKAVKEWKARNPQMQKIDSSYQDYWCSIEILKRTDRKMEKLSLIEVGEFLATLHKSCSNNVEFSEWSNELLFTVVINHPSKFLNIIHKGSSLSRKFILEELKSPITEINIEETKKAIQSVSEPVFKEAKEIIASALEEAKSKS